MRTFRSKLIPNLIVVDKVNGGKADALNVAAGFASHPLVCAIDSDSLLEEESLLRVVIPFILKPDKTVASCGTIRIANGCYVEHSRVVSGGLPKDLIPLIQIVEYMRAFLCGRVGWNELGATLIISGAFGVFDRQTLFDVGGYLGGSVGEDMELVVRIHKYYLDSKRKKEIVFLPDPVCWTEVPGNWRDLFRQRNRWQRGLGETLWKHKYMLLNPKYRMIGMVAFPYFFIFEFFGPIFEVLSLVTVTAGSFLGILHREQVFLFVLVSILYNILMTFWGLMVAARFYARAPSIQTTLTLLGLGVIENLGWRQVMSFVRAKGLWDHFLGKKSWGTLNRSGFSKK